MLFLRVFTRLHRVHKTSKRILYRVGTLHKVLHEFRRTFCHAEHVMQNQHLRISAAPGTDSNDRDIQF